MQDSGVGIKEEDRGKLFTLFGKLDSSKSLNTKGIGLGLNICKKIVEACLGSIHLEDSYREGASFCFSVKAYSKREHLAQGQGGAGLMYEEQPLLIKKRHSTN